MSEFLVFSVMLKLSNNEGTKMNNQNQKRHLGIGSLAMAAAVVVAINGLYMLLVAIGNIFDYQTNFDFVNHVLRMDTTNFGAGEGVGLDPDVMWRAITNETLITIAYIGVIIWETVAAAVLLYATYLWIKSSKTKLYFAARKVSTIGLLMIVILFMGGFITIGGEWFQMWRSVEWNGLEPAFRNSVLAIFGLVLVHLPSPQWLTNEPIE
jgi:predicted small integral membrane protein